MVVHMGVANRMVIELAMQRMMSTSYRDSHANGRRVAYGIVQRLQVRMSSEGVWSSRDTCVPVVGVCDRS